MIEQDIQAFLTTNSAIIALSQGAYLLHMPQGANYPCIAWAKTGDDRSDTYGGQTTLINSQFEINAFSSRFSEAETLTAAIIAELNNYSGTVGGSRVDSVKLQSSIGFYEQETKLYGVANTFIIHHR